VSTPVPAKVLEAAERHGVPAARIGTVRVGSGELRVTLPDGEFSASLRRLGEAFHNTIPAIMGAAASEVAILEQHPSPATV
jgi:hypothetical protein